jgi:hypothetical protein
MSATLTWNGLDELRDALRDLPRALATEAGAIVSTAAEGVRDDVVAAYEAHRYSGNLAEHVVLATSAHGQFGVAFRLRSTAKHAWMFENGTMVRHSEFGNRGQMPAAHVFIPACIRRRRTMYDQLKDMLERHGLKVSGSAK